MISLADYGGVGDGVIDNAGAWAQVIAAVEASSGGERLYIPAGKYKSSVSPVFTYPNRRFSVSVVGDRNATILNFPTTNGLVLNASSPTHTAQVRDLCFTNNIQGNTALAINNTVTLGAFGGSEIEDCDFRGDDTVPGAAWANAVAVTGMCGVKYSGLLVIGAGSGYGNGYVMDTGGVAGPSNASIVHDFSQCKAFNCAAGWVYGSVQGVTLSQCNATNGVTGILVPPGKVNLGQLAVTLSQFNTTSNQILIQSQLTNFLFGLNMVMVSPNASGILFDAPGNWASIIGNQFLGTAPTSSGNGIVALQPFNNGNASGGNVFFRLSIGGDFAATSNWNLANFESANTFNGVTMPMIV